MVVIDADGHVEESPAMFRWLEKEFYERRPLAVPLERDTLYGEYNAIWLIEGKTYHKLTGKGAIGRLGTPTIMERAKKKPFAIPAQELTDVDARLNDLKKVGIDVQVVFPTLFLAPTAEDLKLEAALLRAYNSFMADACAKSQGRIKFAALLPIRDVQESIKELRRAKELGAAALMLLGVAWDRSLGDEALFPLYNEAAELNMPVCVHYGWGCPAITNAFGYSDMRFNSAALPVLMGFHSILASGVLDSIPRLRFAFLEAGCMWLPFLMHWLRRRYSLSQSPEEYFRQGRIYVACEADENINSVVSIIGEDSLVVASDYPHTDPSHEENMVQAIMSREDVPVRVKEKILSTNPQRLYGF